MVSHALDPGLQGPLGFAGLLPLAGKNSQWLSFIKARKGREVILPEVGVPGNGGTLVQTPKTLS